MFSVEEKASTSHPGEALNRQTLNREASNRKTQKVKENEPPILFEPLDESEIRKILDSDIKNIADSEVFFEDYIKDDQAIFCLQKQTSCFYTRL